MSPPGRNRRTGAFTLLELITAVLVVAILIVMLLPVLSRVQNRLERSKCIANLRSLHVAADLYVQEHHSWPQVANSNVAPEKVAADWIDTLHPYGLSQINWICPTIQKILLSPDLSDPAKVRIDYMATPFDTHPRTPYQWNTQPWFVENSDVHGNGNLLIFPDGHIGELGDYKALFSASPTP